MLAFAMITHPSSYLCCTFLSVTDLPHKTAHQLLKLACSEVDQFLGSDHKSQTTSILTIRTPSEKPRRYKTSNFKYKDRQRLRKLHLFLFHTLHPHLFQILFSQPCYPHKVHIKNCSFISLHCYRLATQLAGTVVCSLTHHGIISHAATTTRSAITSRFIHS